jgi:hypothetical protein
VMVIRSESEIHDRSGGVRENIPPEGG